MHGKWSGVSSRTVTSSDELIIISGEQELEVEDLKNWRLPWRDCVFMEFSRLGDRSEERRVGKEC